MILTMITIIFFFYECLSINNNNKGTKNNITKKKKNRLNLTYHAYLLTILQKNIEHFVYNNYHAFSLPDVYKLNF